MEGIINNETIKNAYKLTTIKQNIFTINNVIKRNKNTV